MHNLCPCAICQPNLYAMKTSIIRVLSCELFPPNRNI